MRNNYPDYPGTINAFIETVETSTPTLERTHGTANVARFFKSVWQDFKHDGTQNIGPFLYFLVLIALFLILLGLSSIPA